ncbi:oligodendrocyte-myelin glycoprotein isoform X3 [Silurus meridionalis]|uniref:oligodendrocyte-myelin glycoprotein isoform X3 n=1 Tax=Silurus meridionalis TaxID=175797 RepID=UPI001EEB8349|nr:oligodendrocyte-myelin glycoprotein isoform X3 [Silurus meridionalis]
MERIRTAHTMSASMLVCLLLLILCAVSVLAICPSACSCGRGHRAVDCSARGLVLLPNSLQHNIHFLNLSHNRLQNLDGVLGHFAHLRILDISHNHLNHLPSGLPRALWDIHASVNRIHHLEKNDTAYHWNLQALDLSNNQLERVVFINNTLPSLRALNLSHNKFWTVPTNMPYNLEMIDLSHNFLLQILPGSLDRLARLSQFFLHANRFASVSESVFNRLEALQLLTLGDNPWACEDEQNITYLLNWMQQTPAKVLGCPCFIRPTCGEAHLSTTRTRHSASYTEPPLGTDTRDQPHVHAITSGYLSKSALLNFPDNWSIDNSSGASEQALNKGVGLLTSTPYSLSSQTSTTIRTRSAKKPLPERARSTSIKINHCKPHTVALILLGTAIILSTF